MRPPPAAPIRRPAQGFTLLEVLIALTVVATALGAGLRAVGSLAQNGEHLRRVMMATWSAENRLAQLRLSGEWPAPGERSFACPQAELALLCTERIFSTPNPNFRRIEVSVADNHDPARPMLKLTQVIPHEKQ